MCDNCIATVQYSSGFVGHIGYHPNEDDPYISLMDGDIVLNNKRFSQDKYFDLWDTLERKGVQEVHGDDGCRICDRNLVTVPAIPGECEGCGVSKHDKFWEIQNNHDQIQEEMEIWDEEYGGFGPGKELDPIEIAIRVGLHCPDGHWVCSDCLMYDGV